ncbi:histidine phosphatase family protein [Paenibacillus xylanexedens]|uniref:histidine phosphatase family protein n=1 Tax=Paenibacillus xylanexedens TaxID=528191 RepID=UPI000B335AC2|nr:histidine phosphatase family protein [Paenibacillus xylanexedens]
MVINAGNAGNEVHTNQPGPLKRNILWVRHGTTLWNVEKRYLGQTDIGLLPNAKEELAPLHEQLSGISWHEVYCSDLLRCRQMLEKILPDAIGQVKFDSRLRENDFGEWEGLTYDQLKDNPVYRSWIDAPQEVTPPGGESWQEFTGRLDSFLQEMLLEGRSSMHVDEGQAPTIVVVTHGGVIRYALSRLIAGLGFWDTHVVPGQVIQVQLDQQGNQWFGSRVTFPPIGL